MDQDAGDSEGFDSPHRESAACGTDFDGDDFRTVTRLVDAALGVAILPTLTLIGAAAGVVARPIAGQSLRRFVHSCRLGTSRVPTPVADLEQRLNQAVAAMVLGARSGLNERLRSLRDRLRPTTTSPGLP